MKWTATRKNLEGGQCIRCVLIGNVSLAALIMVLVSALLHAAWNAAAKASDDPVTFLFCVDLATSLLLLPGLLFFEPAAITPSLWALIAASGVVHGFYASWLTRAYERAELTVVYTISRSTPAFVPLVAVPMLGERLSIRGGLGILLVVASLWLVLTESTGFRWRGLLRPGVVYAYLTLAATVAYSLIDAAAIRQLDALDWRNPLPRPLAFFLLLQLLHLPVFGLLARRQLTRAKVLSACTRHTGWLLLAAAGGTASYWLILEAMRSAEISYIVAVRQASVLFALLFGARYLDERASGTRVFGIAGTIAGVVLIALA